MSHLGTISVCFTLYEGCGAGVGIVIAADMGVKMGAVLS